MRAPSFSPAFAAFAILGREMDALEIVLPDHGRDIGARLQDRRHNGHKAESRTSSFRARRS